MGVPLGEGVTSQKKLLVWHGPMPQERIMHKILCAEDTKERREGQRQGKEDKAKEEESMKEEERYYAFMEEQQRHRHVFPIQRNNGSKLLKMMVLGYDAGETVRNSAKRM